MSKAWHAKRGVFLCSIQISRTPSRNSTPNYWNKSCQNNSRLNSNRADPQKEGREHKSGCVPRRYPTLTLKYRNMTVGVISLCTYIVYCFIRTGHGSRSKISWLYCLIFRLFGVACNRKEGRDDNYEGQSKITESCQISQKLWSVTCWNLACL